MIKTILGLSLVSTIFYYVSASCWYKKHLREANETILKLEDEISRLSDENEKNLDALSSIASMKVGSVLDYDLITT